MPVRDLPRRLGEVKRSHRPGQRCPQHQGLRSPHQCLEVVLRGQWVERITGRVDALIAFCVFLWRQQPKRYEAIGQKWSNWYPIPANCSCFDRKIPILTLQKGRKSMIFTMYPYFCKNLSVVMYRKFRDIPIFEDFPPICPYFLGFRIGRCDILMGFLKTSVIKGDIDDIISLIPRLSHRLSYFMARA